MDAQAESELTCSVLAVAERWGRFNAPQPLPVLDSLFAATAKVHGLVLVTRNVRHVCSF